uniref:Glycine--tRNA ligase beta subunit n=1 Tax=Zeugodacus cucurbitae TaxID=28588 RepID=A0A0A1XQ04_ZEUCU
MGRNSNATFVNNARIQKEQLQLCKIQKELETIIGRVNEAINELKVEELQLKAGAAAALSENMRSANLNKPCEQELPSTSNQASLSLAQLPHNIPCRSTEQDNVQIDAVIINKQIIYLNTDRKANNNIEEEEEDDI